MNILKKLENKKPVTIVCLGDSITFGYKPNVRGTVQVEMPYPKKLELLLKEKYQYEDITVINSGVPGWQVGQALKHINKKVLDFEPDLCIIMYGINDARGSWNGGLPLFKSMYQMKYQMVIDKLAERKIKTLLLTPTYAFAWRLEEFTQIVKELSTINKVPVINNYLYTQKLFKDLEIDAKVGLPDKIHLRDDLYGELAVNVFNCYFNRN